jgi:hypothetical protein
MPITMKEFAARFEQRQREAQETTKATDAVGADNVVSSARCVYCGKPIREMQTGSRPTTKGRSCSDCYFGEMGKWVAKHPIYVPEELAE